MSRIRPFTARLAPNDKYPVYTLHRTRFVSLTVIFRINCNSDTVTFESVVRICTRIFHDIQISVGQNKWNLGQQWMPRAILSTRAIGSSVMGQVLADLATRFRVGQLRNRGSIASRGRWFTSSPKCPDKLSNLPTFPLNRYRGRSAQQSGAKLPKLESLLVGLIMSGNKLPLAFTLVWCVMGLQRHAHERQLMCT